MEELKKRLKLSLALIVLIIASGTLGYMVIEGWNLLDSIYMTIITITTVGYREIRELSFSGIIFTKVPNSSALPWRSAALEGISGS